MRTSLVESDGLEVIGVCDCGSGDGTEELRDDVEGHFAPGEVAECRECNSDLDYISFLQQLQYVLDLQQG